MKFHQSKKLKDGSCLVTLQVNEDAWWLAETTYHFHGYDGLEDYLNAILNTGMDGQLDRYNEAEARREAEAGIAPPVTERPAPSSNDPDDLDDGIPF